MNNPRTQFGEPVSLLGLLSGAGMNVSKPKTLSSLGDKQPVKAETLLSPQAAWWVGESYERAQWVWASSSRRCFLQVAHLPSACLRVTRCSLYCSYKPAEGGASWIWPVSWTSRSNFDSLLLELKQLLRRMVEVFISEKTAKQQSFILPTRNVDSTFDL